MFEKDADEYAIGLTYPKFQDNQIANIVLRDVAGAFQQGAEFGYNKANEWHDVGDGDLPKEDNKIVLCICGNGFINGKRNYKLRPLTRGEFPLFQPVYWWKEVVLPKELAK